MLLENIFQQFQTSGDLGMKFLNVLMSQSARELFLKYFYIMLVLAQDFHLRVVQRLFETLLQVYFVFS